MDKIIGKRRRKCVRRRQGGKGPAGGCVDAARHCANTSDLEKREEKSVMEARKM